MSNTVTMNSFDLIEFFSKTTKKFIVEITYQFNLDDDSDPCSWNSFVKLLSSKYPIEVARDYFSAIINNEVIVFEEASKAWDLYRIMEKEPYYSNVYACISGPDGLITENT